MGPQSLLQMDSQRVSEFVRDLSFLQVMEKEIIESVGSNNRIEKRWSWDMLVMGDDDDPLLLLLLLLVCAML